MFSVIALVMLISGCQTQSPKSAAQKPVAVPKGTLVATAHFSAYAFVGGHWKALLGTDPNDNPSDVFQSIDFTPGGKPATTTVGSNDNSLMGNQVELWVYDKGWKEVAVNGDKTVAHYAWSPSKELYIVSDNGTTMGVLADVGGHWQTVKGSTALGFISSIEFSPTGRLTVTAQASSDGSSTVYQYQGGAWHRLNAGNAPFAADALQVTWSPDGILTLGTSQHGVWQYVGGHWTQPSGVSTPIGNITQLAWSPKGQLLVSGDAQTSRGLWALSNGKWSAVGGATGAIASHGIRQFGWSPSGTLVASDATTGELLQWQSGAWQPIWTRTNVNRPVPPLFGWSPSGVLLCNGGSVGGLWQYQAGHWSQVGGANSPLKSQTPVDFAWSAQ